MSAAPPASSTVLDVTTTPAPAPAPAPRFDRSLADGVRLSRATVGVDSGTMVVAGGRFPSDGEYDDVVGGELPRIGRSWAASTSGYGDGGYDVVEVQGPDGEPRGCEVVFLSATIDAAATERLGAEDGQPSEAEMRSYYDRAASEETRTKVGRWHEVERRVYDAVWTELLGGLHPADEATALALGTLELTDEAQVGDPCYGGPSAVLALPSGTYQAVAWQADGGGWGERTARLGIYLLA